MPTANTTTTTTARNTCKHPGCTEPAVPATGPGRPPEYCVGRGHTGVTAWRERRYLAAVAAGATASPADTDSPVTMAKVTGAELLRALRAEADRDVGIADRLRQAVETLTDPTAAEAEV
jgi:colicin import membrane protein